MSGSLFYIFQQPRFANRRIASQRSLFRTAIAVPAGESSRNAHLHPCRVVVIVVAVAATYVFQIWREDNGKSIRVGYMVRVTLPYTFVPFCCLFIQSVRDWTTRVPFSFEELHSPFGGRRSAEVGRAQMHCEIRKIAISWSLDWAANRRPANRALVSVAHRLTSRLTLASADSAPLNYRLGINSRLPPSLSLSLICGTCRGFIPLFLFLFFSRTPYNGGIKASRAAGVQNVMGRNVEHSDGNANRLKMYASRWLMGLNFSWLSR